MPGALALARPVQVIVVSVRGIAVVLVVAALAAGLALGFRARQAGGPAQTALTAHIAGVEPEDAAYPRLGAAIRARAWLASTPDQPEGVALFVDLPDAVFGREREVTASDLRETMRRIGGLAWDAGSRAWIGGGRRVPLAEVRELLVAAAPTPSDADAVIGLLLGSPAPGAPDFASLLRVDPPTLGAIRIVPFHGQQGRLLLDRGRAPYAAAELGYNGLMASFTGPGWPTGWRVLRLKSLDP